MIRKVNDHAYDGDTDLGEIKDLQFVGDIKGKVGCFVIDGSFIPYDPDNPVVASETECFEAYFEAHANDPAHVPSLDDVKAAKKLELWEACNQDILSGFHSLVTGEDLLWGFDDQDQANLNQQLTAIAAGIASEPVYWKPKGDAIPRSLTFDQFKQLCIDAQTNKVTKVQLEWNLSAQVDASTTVEEVNSIVW